jgi:hypothetical protein
MVVGEACVDALRSLPPAERATLCERWWWEGEAPPPEGLSWSSEQLTVAPSHNPPETASIRLHQPAFHIFTSGTTGLPKASVMSHYRWHRCMSGMGIMGLRLRPDDVLYCPLPLYHNNSALTVSWGAVVGAGASLVLAPKFSASRFWDDMRRHQATSFCYIGELCRYLLNQPARPDDRQHRGARDDRQRPAPGDLGRVPAALRHRPHRRVLYRQRVQPRPSSTPWACPARPACARCPLPSCAWTWTSARSRCAMRAGACGACRPARPGCC